MNATKPVNPPSNSAANAGNAKTDVNAQNRRPPTNDRRDRRGRGGNRNQQSAFKPKIETVESLSSSDEKKRQDYSKF